MKIENKVLKQDYIKLSDLKWIQGNLKKITDKNLNKLIESIKRNGIIKALHVWQHPKTDELWCLDGNHLKKALEKIKESGNEIPEIVKADFIECLDEKHAKELVLVYSAIYAEITSEGLMDFIKIEDIDFDEIIEEISIPNINIENILNDDLYTKKIERPIYEPKNDKPQITELYDINKTSQLIEEINAANINNDEKIFLIEAAKRHTIFNYEKIADYYANSDEKTQRLMEKSALVIIDFESAIEGGFTKLASGILEQYNEEY